ncbi:AraC family transcriptional regulator InvF [Pluralibacter sp.]|uniref:AraC family transcriptional regulator InvF n=1 Tax=Pluralibacter sp. TaxID=1920032 RepID=UPI0025EC41F4|nr:AraC family transcriptional regulator InvF [Pluralibacter sp.]MBV8045310.1 AraC family transcriptional regulator InvF [Pluralibacter sp.]
MTDHDVLNQQEILGEGDKRGVPTQEAWLLQISGSNAVQLELSWEGQSTSWEATGNALLLLDRVDVRVLKGTLSLRPLRLEVLSKLLVFIDEARNVADFDTDNTHWAPLQLEDVTMWQDRKRCEYWFLQQMLDPSPTFSHLLALLRRSESYWLVRFLLAQSTCNSTLQELGQRYGVSYSHFRRLCRHALGSAAKSELRDWRMARSLLDVVEGQENLTQVAIKHGYASSSHFSNEIRELLGVSPRGLSNIIQLATK